MLEWRPLLLKCCFFFSFFKCSPNDLTWTSPFPPAPHAAVLQVICTAQWCFVERMTHSFLFNTVHKFCFISTVISYPALVQAQGSSNNASNFCISFNVGNVKHIVLTVQHLLVFLLLPLLVWVLILQREKKKKIVIDFFKKTKSLVHVCWM